MPVLTINKQRLPVMITMLVAGLLFVSSTATGKETESTLTHAELTASPAEILSHAQQWELTAAEWQRYQQLMQGIRGSLSLPTISPIEVLGIHARNDAERRRYAEQWARLLYRDAERVLAFQRAYDAAVKRLFPQQPLIDPAKLPNRRFQSLNAAPGDRLMFFTTLNCVRCDAHLRRLIGSLGQRSIPLGIDIYLFTQDVDGNTDAQIRSWAQTHSLPPEQVQDGTITLNHDNGTWFRVTGNPVPDKLPAVIHRRRDQFTPLPLSALDVK